jgi:hypothetical protein
MIFFREAIKKRDDRAKKAKKEGRVPGKTGRPPINDTESDDVILKEIVKDAKVGIFHDLKWLENIVCFFFFDLLCEHSLK